MAPPIINNDAVRGETFLPGQIFVFGGLVLQANLLGRLEQIDSYALGHLVRFGSLNYVADICGDLLPCVPGGRGFCRCQNRRISGRGSRTVRLGSMVTGDGGHDVYPGSGPLYGGNTLLPA